MFRGLILYVRLWRTCCAKTVVFQSPVEMPDRMDYNTK